MNSYPVEILYAMVFQWSNRNFFAGYLDGMETTADEER
jgi:hypothetical protein